MRNLFFFTILILSISRLFSQNVLHVPAQYSTIQLALNAAQSNDTILVQPGVYNENLFWPNVNGIKLISAGDSNNTIINGLQNSTVIYISSTALLDTNTIIGGFKITGGSNISYGGGIYLNNSSPTFIDCSITDNNASITGGGVYMINSYPVFKSVNIANNFAFSGGGIWSELSGPRFYNCIIKNNHTYSNGLIGDDLPGGGGIFFKNSNATLSYCKFIKNYTDSYGYSAGGGINMVQGSNIYIIGCTFSNNIAKGGGGGIYSRESFPRIENSNIENNISTNGGGIFFTNNYTTNGFIKNSNIISNRASEKGGGIYGQNSSAPLILRTIISGNSANEGGGIHCGYTFSPYIDSCQIIQNIAQTKGGGIFATSSNLKLSNSIIANNFSHQDGGGLFIESSYPSIFEKLFIVFNSALNLGGGLYFDNSSYNFWYGKKITLSFNKAIKGSAIYSKNNSNFAYYYINVYYNSTYAIVTEQNSFPVFYNSNIYGNGISLTNYDNSQLVSALNCWWGSYSGPYHPIQNQAGLGDTVNFFTNIIPFAANPDTTAPPLPPENLIITNLSSNFLSLAWDRSLLNDFAYYKIYWDTDSSGFPYSFSDIVGIDTFYTLRDFNPNINYFISLTTVDLSGNESWFSKELIYDPPSEIRDSLNLLDITFSLYQNFPNPFNPSTKISWQSPVGGYTILKVYDILGREIATLVDEYREAGKYEVEFPDVETGYALSLRSGVYFYQLRIGNYTETKKMVLIR